MTVLTPTDRTPGSGHTSDLLAALRAWRDGGRFEAIVVTHAGTDDLWHHLAGLEIPMLAADASPAACRDVENRAEARSWIRVRQGRAGRLLADLRESLPPASLYVLGTGHARAADGSAPADEIFWIPRGNGLLVARLDPEAPEASAAGLHDALLRWSPDHGTRIVMDGAGRPFLLAWPRPRVHVTFLIEEYTAEYGTSGRSINMDNLVATLDQTGMATWNVVHYDRCFDRGQPIPIDAVSKPADADHHLLVCTCHYHSRANPTTQLLRRAQASGSKIVFVWLDKKISQDTPDYFHIADLNVVLDGNDFELPNAWPIYTPKNPIYFNDPGLARDVDVSLAGEIRYLAQRKAFRALLEGERRIPVTQFATSAADTGRSLTVAEYARIYQRSRISLVMTKDAVRQLKGRIFEVMHCGALALCDVNHHVRTYFTPGVHYVEYRDYEDLVAKARYYLDHEGERGRIARAGYERVKGFYNHEVFWRGILARVGASAVYGLGNA